MNLYKVKLKGMGTHYVVSTDPTTAYNIIREEYDRKDYGFNTDRVLSSIELIAEHAEYPDSERLWIQCTEVVSEKTDIKEFAVQCIEQIDKELYTPNPTLPEWQAYENRGMFKAMRTIKKVMKDKGVKLED